MILAISLLSYGIGLVLMYIGGCRWWDAYHKQRGFNITLLMFIIAGGLLATSLIIQGSWLTEVATMNNKEAELISGMVAGGCVGGIIVTLVITIDKMLGN